MKLEKALTKPAREVARCQAVVPAGRGWHNKEEHQCPFAAEISGYCRRHNPAFLRESWTNQIAKKQQEIAALEEKMRNLP